MAKKMIGLEFDVHELRAVELSGDRVEAYGKAPLPPGVIEEGFIARPDEASRALKALLKQNSFKCTDVCIGVNNQNVIVRMASFRKMTPEKQRNLIMLQAQEFIPLPLAELQLDYVPCQTRMNGQEEFLNVLLVGARKKMLQEIMHVVSSAKLLIHDIDAGLLAAGRAALAASRSEVFGVLQFESGTLNILIFNKETIAFARSVQMAPGIRQEIIRGGALTEMCLSSLKEVISAEMTSSVNYYRMQNDQPLEMVYLYGMAAEGELQSIADHVGGQIGVSVTVPKLYQTIATMLPVQVYAGCISLAKKGMEV
ncbi:MAG: pilus assembly protein PilM [Gracilibacteraceae bacterium]|jgi:type IV pilus assembly protein PilM|nr:pilus assembly protein PilM [Gracilibacteraceae bacterium]